MEWGLMVSMIFSGEQIRAARALARIDQIELAVQCGLSVETIKRLERIRGPIDANIRTLRAIDDAFRRIGITFNTGDEGATGVWLTNSTDGLVKIGRRASVCRMASGLRATRNCARWRATACMGWWIAALCKPPSSRV